MWRVYWEDVYDSHNERVFSNYEEAMDFYYDVLDSPFSVRVRIFPLYRGD